MRKVNIRIFFFNFGLKKLNGWKIKTKSELNLFQNRFFMKYNEVLLFLRFCKKINTEKSL
ncbi:hypothetical protein AMR47_09450 [Leptospira interrogans]|nr:hypothetical protein AMR47_09450 [Leptospira interrogans]